MLNVGLLIEMYREVEILETEPFNWRVQDEVGSYHAVSLDSYLG